MKASNSLKSFSLRQLGLIVKASNTYLYFSCRIAYAASEIFSMQTTIFCTNTVSLPSETKQMGSSKFVILEAMPALKEMCLEEKEIFILFSGKSS